MNSQKLCSLQLPAGQVSLSQSIWPVAWLSFFWSFSSLMVFSLLPNFLTEELHLSYATLGWMEGVAISASFFAKILSGTMSDYYQKRKPFILIGSITTVMCKPLFAIAMTGNFMFITRFLDRLSKGVRSAPTDALVSDLSVAKDFSSAYGLRQALYTWGAVCGALCSMMIMYISGNNYRLVFAMATIPAFLAVIVQIFWVKSPWDDRPNVKRVYHRSRVALQFQYHDVKSFSPAFWLLMLSTFLLMLGRFSEAFLLLHAKDIGLAVMGLPFVLVVMDVCHSLAAYPFGKIADRKSRGEVLVYGILLFVLADLLLYISSNMLVGFLGICLLGIHLGITQGLLRSLVAEYTPSHMRGTAFAIFYLVCAFGIMVSNVMAGSVSHHYGLASVFLVGGFWVALSALFLYLVRPKRKDLQVTI